MSSILASESVQEALSILQNEFPLAIWETFYVTVVSTAIAIVIGLPLGILLAVGGKDGILPLPRWLMTILDVCINLLRSVPSSDPDDHGHPTYKAHRRYAGRHCSVHRTACYRIVSVHCKACRKLHP